MWWYEYTKLCKWFYLCFLTLKYILLGVSHCLDGSDELLNPLCTVNRLKLKTNDDNKLNYRTMTVRNRYWYTLLSVTFLCIICTVCGVSIICFISRRYCSNRSIESKWNVERLIPKQIFILVCCIWEFLFCIHRR